MKPHVLLFRLLPLLPLLPAAVAACSSSSSPGGSGQSDASTAAETSTGDDAAGGDTWASWGQGFFTRYCVECHGVSDPKGLDFGVQATVVANQDDIRCGVAVTQDPSWSCGPTGIAAKQFPISDSAGTNPKPSDAERARVVAWIDAGCP
jgi:hypothetical protein